MAEHGADYHRGEMNVQEQKATYHGFLVLSKWGSLAIAVGLVFFTLLFCTKTGFWISGLAAVIFAGLGFLALVEKKGAGGH